MGNPSETIQHVPFRFELPSYRLCLARKTGGGKGGLPRTLKKGMACIASPQGREGIDQEDVNVLVHATEPHGAGGIGSDASQGTKPGWAAMAAVMVAPSPQSSAMSWSRRPWAPSASVALAATGPCWIEWSVILIPFARLTSRVYPRTAATCRAPHGRQKCYIADSICSAICERSGPTFARKSPSCEDF